MHAQKQVEERKKKKKKSARHVEISIKAHQAFSTYMIPIDFHSQYLKSQEDQGYLQLRMVSFHMKAPLTVHENCSKNNSSTADRPFLV